MKLKIIEESLNQFERQGFSATSIQQIMEATGATKGTFYYHFNSKEQLLMDFHTDYIDDLHDRLFIKLAPLSSPIEKLRAVVELLILDIQTNGQQARVYFREMRHLSPDHAELIKEKRKQFRNVIELIIEQGIAEKEFRRELNPRLTSYALLGMTNWSYQWFDVDGTMSLSELADTYTTLLLQGMMQTEE
ncbi:TetR/AcrR family transcriptional regulator [Solibacillus sp. FSL H8-0538]|uniref:TetR/AcrR family transcriptional regulator n=1 Tax=Solibacillus sp. FSL H8-0538 TaxID=2921400 RepID=UPI0030FB7E9B